MRSYSQTVAAALAGLITVILVTSVLVVARRSPGAQRVAVGSLTRGPYEGLGTWVDMYSWSNTFTAGAPRFGGNDVAAMAALGVQTLYIQAASQTGPPTVLEADRLLPLMADAHRAGMTVVVWYLPSLVNPADDMIRLQAISHLPADGVAVDIESTDVADIGARNAALVALSRRLRAAVGNRPLGAIVLPATLLEVVNTRYWPDFPYADLAPSFDAWLPMVYWTDRLTASGYRDGYRYTADSVQRLRSHLGPALGPAARINPIGGVSVDGIGLADMAGFVNAAKDTHSVGGSIYEWPGTTAAAWPVLQGLRAADPGRSAATDRLANGRVGKRHPAPVRAGRAP